MYPWSCSLGHLQMIDIGVLERHMIDKLHDAEGYICNGCGNWVTVFVSTRSLDNALQKLEKMRVERPDYRYHFLKVLRKATAIQWKANYG